MTLDPRGLLPACLWGLLSACSGQSGTPAAASGAATSGSAASSGQISTGGAGDSDAQTPATAGQIVTDAGATSPPDGAADGPSLVEDATGTTPVMDGAVAAGDEPGPAHGGPGETLRHSGPAGTRVAHQ